MVSGRKATVNDLSQRSGHSASTVSAVLNGSWRKRRIRAETAEAILNLAAEMNYSVNRQAQGLRTSSSGLVALLLPLYDNRFFSNVAQTFEAHVRAMGLTPIVSSAGRDPTQERATMERLIGYAPDALFICGATYADGLAAMCKDVGMPIVSIDLPSRNSHSVISDNRTGARRLARSVIDDCLARKVSLQSEDFFFFGGRADHNTQERLAGFLDARATLPGGSGADEGCFVSGYSPAATRRDLKRVIAERGRLPRALFFNSTLNLEGLLSIMAEYPTEWFKDLVVGCVDFDPFASFLTFPVHMMAQDVKSMLGKAFELLPRWSETPEVHSVEPHLIAPRSAVSGPIFKLKDVD